MSRTKSMWPYPSWIEEEDETGDEVRGNHRGGAGRGGSGGAGCGGSAQRVSRGRTADRGRRVEVADKFRQ